MVEAYKIADLLFYISHLETAMATTQFFILQDFWPVLKFCQILGIFPCKKVTDENGGIKLIPMKTWMVFLLFFTCSLILNAPSIGIMIYLESDSQVISAYTNAFIAPSKDSLTRLYVFYFLTLMTMIFQIILLLSNIASLKALSCLQDEFTIMFGRTGSKNSSIKKAYLLSGILFGFILLHAITYSLGYFLPMLDFVGDGQNDLRNLAIAMVFFTVLPILFSSFSVCQGLILHLQLCSNVKLIMKSFDFNEMTSSRTVLENTVKMLKTVRMSSTVLSSLSLILTLNALILLICDTYLFMDYALSSANQFESILCTQNISGALSAILTLWILNGQSEEIKQIISKLKDTLGDLVVSDGTIQMDGRFHSESYARGHLINKLAEFQGFDAYGYATLGKPLLTSVFSNFITYLIILIQFKISIDKPE